MASQKFLGQRLHDVGERKGSLLLRHPGMEDDLQQEVAKLLAQVIEVTPRNRVGDLIGFLDRVRGDSRKILRQVPRTSTAGSAQRRHDVEELGDIAGMGHERPDEGEGGRRKHE